MSFSIEEIRKVAPVARVVVADTKGSVPREVGASMLVGQDFVTGTIGGGALEHTAIERAKQALIRGKDRLDRIPLGPSLGQCCGGSVSLLTEIWDQSRLGKSNNDLVARPLPGAAIEMPLAVRRVLSSHRSGGLIPRAGIVADWMIEPVTQPDRQIWIWGAGHVGRAIVQTIAPLPKVEVIWVDTGHERFPSTFPDGVKTLIAEDPADLVTISPSHAEHFVLTFSHALDLEICHRILGGSFGRLGLIGSATKRARFRKRLSQLGHSMVQIDRMECPIGDPSVGKHPQEIAVSVAMDILQNKLSAAQPLGERA